MRKKLGILIITILSVGMILTGCTRKSPTDVVNAYFTELKKGNNEQASEFIESAFSQTEEGTSEETSEETDEIMEEAIMLYLSKTDAKVLSENIDEDNAIVEVEINGPNFANILMEVIRESIVDAFSGNGMDEDYMSKSFLEKVKESKSETRTGSINLIKEDKEWKIKSDYNVLTLVFGMYNE